jgi:type IV secretory pathway TrbL component
MIAIVFFAAMLATLLVAVLAFRRGRSDSLLRALTLRVGLSVLFFALLMLAWWAGWIQPHGLGG